MPIQLKTKQGNISLTAPKATGGSVDLSNYYTKAQADEMFLTREDWEIAVPAFLTEIPEEYLTEEEANDKYAKIADIPDVPDVSGFLTEEEVIALIKEHGGGSLPASEEGEF